MSIELSDNFTKILVALITVLGPAIVAGIRIVYREYRRMIQSPPAPPTDPVILRKDLIRGIFIGLGIGVLFLIGIYLITRPPNHMVLWNFKQSSQNWQPEKLSKIKTNAAATGIGWDAQTKSLRGEFNFGVPLLSPGEKARATYFVNVPQKDWSAFRTLAFQASNQSTHDLHVTFSVSDSACSSCWYEFGIAQPLPAGQTSELKFDLTQPHYMTCQLTTGGFNYAAPPFKGVYRFDIIVAPEEVPTGDVTGSVLIKDVQLMDRISP
jgi:hypothetical protein